MKILEKTSNNAYSFQKWAKSASILLTVVLFSNNFTEKLYLNNLDR